MALSYRQFGSDAVSGGWIRDPFGLPALSALELLSSIGPGGEADAGVGTVEGDQVLQHQHPVAAPDDLGVHRQRQGAARHLAERIGELVALDLLDL